MRKQSSRATKRQNTGQVVATTPPPSIPIIHTNATLSRQKVTALKQKADENKLLNNRIAELESALKSAQTRVKNTSETKAAGEIKQCFHPHSQIQDKICLSRGTFKCEQGLQC